MLIYNSAKEFIGIDENDLKILGFSNLSQLRSEAADFADLFVHKPGYVHNFQHVHWIDFVSCAESAEESKVIISVKSKSYTANLAIAKAFLSDNPGTEAYFIFLNNLRALSAQESDSIASEIISKPAPVAAIDEKDEIVEAVVPQEEPYRIHDEPLDLDIDFEEEEINESPVEFPDEKPESAVSIKPVQKEDNESYVYDPQVASDELGLPVDLIEEFMQDFIAQADEFKSEMYSSLSENDIENVARLSHKLKGVAANLRIENALSAITTVNVSKDADVIKTNLDLFYKIMRKLAGKPAVEEIKTIDEEEDFVLDFKDDNEEEVVKQEDDFVLEFKEEASVEDVEVPEKIDIPELGDNLNIATDIEVEESIEIQEPIDTKEAVEEVSYSKELSANAIGLDMETFEELFTDYVKDTHNISSHIHEALSQNDFDKCAKEARMLKGMSDSMQMKDFSSELECLMSSSDKNEMTKAIQKIDNVIEQISKQGLNR